MHSVKNLLIPPTTTVFECIQKIDSGAFQIVFVVDDKNRLMGTVTDGDIRRGLLKGVELDHSVSAAMNSAPFTIREDSDRGEALSIMRQREIRRVPILDDENVVIGFETLGELRQSESVDNTVVLMAGGLGKRLRPMTHETPKPLLEIGSRPLIETIVMAFAAQGFRRFFISINYKGELIEEHFGAGEPWNVQIEYLRETKYLGTAGALQLLPERPTEPIIVMNGDLLTSVNFRQLLDFHAEHQAAATMCVRNYSFQVPYGVVQMEDHNLTGIVEKPAQSWFVNAGMYVLSPQTLELMPSGSPFDMTDLFSAVIRRGDRAVAFPIREYWLDIGHVEDLRRARAEFNEVFG